MGGGATTEGGPLEGTRGVSKYPVDGDGGALIKSEVQLLCMVCTSVDLGTRGGLESTTSEVKRSTSSGLERQ